MTIQKPSEHPKSEPVSNAEKDPADWVTGDQPMTGAQASYLKTLSEESGEAFEEGLTKAEASIKIDELRDKTGKGDDLGLHNVAGTNRTACNCGAKGNICQCAAGKCDCSSCPKNSDVKSTTRTAEEAEMEFVEVDGQKKTKCNCGGTDEKCPCEPGKCACSGCSKSS